MGARFSIGLSRAHPGAHHGEEYRFAGRLRSERRHRGAAAGQEAYASEERARGVCVRVGPRLPAPRGPGRGLYPAGEGAQRMGRAAGQGSGVARRVPC